jgi:hypothetical protein
VLLLWLAPAPAFPTILELGEQFSFSDRRGFPEITDDTPDTVFGTDFADFS